MNGWNAFQKINDLDDDLLEEARILSPTGALPRHPPAWWTRMVDFCESGVGIAIISCIVALSVLSGIVIAGHRTPPTNSPPAHGTPSDGTITDTNPPVLPLHDYTFGEGFVEMVEYGGIAGFISWSPILTPLLYGLAIGGFLIQYRARRKKRGPIRRWLFFGLCCVGAVIGDYLMQVISGWNVILITIVYGANIALLLGALVAIVLPPIYRIIRGRFSKNHNDAPPTDPQ